MVDLNAAFDQQFFNVAVGQVVAQVPAHRDHDHLRWESEPGERRFRWLPRPRTARRLHCSSLPRSCQRSTQRAPWDGQYTIRDLGPYQWKLAFPAYDGQHAWAWSGGAANRASATPVQVVAGETNVLDVSLPATGTVSGTVTVPTRAVRRVRDAHRHGATTGDYAAIRTTARSDGTFAMRGFNTQDVRPFYSVGDGLVEYPTLLHTTAGGAVTGITIAIPAS